ncbi:hypothetical protein BOX15_Mlig021614g5, partial [Macrostomum lignano]
LLTGINTCIMLSGTGDKPTCAPLHTWSPELQSAYRILQDFLGSSLRHLAYVFINPVDSSEPGAEEYYDRIKEPMCLLKMKEKFGQSVYSQIGDFVCDFRLMLFNCYVFNGVDSPLGKLATKMETLFEQKIGLLARDLRERCSIGATMGAASLGTVLDSRSYLHEGGANNNPALLVEDPAAEWRVARRAAAAMRVVSGIGAGASGGGANNAGGSTGGLSSFAACRESLPVQAMARETEDAAGSREESDARIAAIVERLRRWEVRRHEERLLSEFESWINSLATTETEYCLRHCAELAEVAHFLLMMGPEMLGLQASGLAEALTVREIHLALLSPQSSALLTGIMCGLFAKLKCGLARATKDAAAAAAAAANAALGCGGSSYSFYNRAPLPAIVYHHWHDRLKQRVAAFYRHLASLAGANDNNQELNQQQSAAVATSFLCSQFGDVVGHRNPLEIRMFHELSLFQRVHILKALIDCLLYRTDQFVRELDERCQPEEYREIRLGSVGQWVYIRLEGLDLEARHWVYRRSEYPVIEYCVQQSASKNSKKKKATPTPEKAGAGAASGRKRKAASPSPCQTPTPKSTSSTSRGRRRRTAAASPPSTPTPTPRSTSTSTTRSGRGGRRSRLADRRRADGDNDVEVKAEADAATDSKSSTPPPPVLKREEEHEAMDTTEASEVDKSAATAAPQLSLANGETNGKEKQEVEEEKVDDKTDENNDSTASANADASASTSASTAPAADEEAAATEAQADEDDDERDEENDKKLIEEMYKVNIERPNASEFELVAQTLSELRALISGLRDDLDALQRSKDEFDVKISKRGRKSKSVLAVDSDALNSQISSHRELLDAFVALEADWEAAAPKISHRERRMRVRVMHEFREFERNSDYYLRGELAEEAAMDSPAADEAAEDADYDDDNDDEIDSGSDELDEDDNNDDDGSDQRSVAMDDSNVGISTRRRKYRIRQAPPPPPPPQQQQQKQQQLRNVGPRPPPQLPQLHSFGQQQQQQHKSATIVRLVNTSDSAGSAVANVHIKYESAARQATASSLLQQHLNNNTTNNNSSVNANSTNNSSNSSASAANSTAANSGTLPILSIRLTTPPAASSSASSAASSALVVGQVVNVVDKPVSSTQQQQQQSNNPPPATLIRSNLTQTVDCLRGPIPTTRLQQTPAEPFSASAICAQQSRRSAGCCAAVSSAAGASDGAVIGC